MIIISSAQHCQIYRDPLFQQPDSDCEQNLIRKTQDPHFPENGLLGFSSMPTQLVADQFSSNCYRHTHETPKRRVCSFSFFWRGMQQCQEGVRGGGGRGGEVTVHSYCHRVNFKCCQKVCAPRPAGETANCALNLFMTCSQLQVPSVTLTFCKVEFSNESQPPPQYQL